jgi:hypothetical protein
MTSLAAFIKESRMSFAEPIGLNRKSGAAEGSAVPRTFLGNVFRQSSWAGCGTHKARQEIGNAEIRPEIVVTVPFTNLWLRDETTQLLPAGTYTVGRLSG